MRLDKISENVYANCEGKTGGNVGVIVLDDRVAVVDAQFPASGRDFRASIQSVTDKPVTHLLLTHMHSDHVLGSPTFEDCEIVGHVPEDRTLFAGDLIVPKSFLWAGDPTASPEAWIGGFRKMLERDVDIIVPGHGQPCDKEEVRTQLAYFEATRRVMVKLIAEGASEEEAVNYDGYPDFYESTGGEKPHYMRAWYRILFNKS